MRFYASLTSSANEVESVSWDEKEQEVQIHFRNNGSMAYMPFISMSLPMWKALNQAIIDAVPAKELI